MQLDIIHDYNFVFLLGHWNYLHPLNWQKGADLSILLANVYYEVYVDETDIIDLSCAVIDG